MGDRPKLPLWERLETVKSPMEILLRTTFPNNVFSFIAGTRAVYDLVVQMNPDVIFLPERGAGPIGWTLDVWEREQGNKAYPKVLIPIGSWTDVRDSEYTNGISDREKHDVIFRELQGIPSSLPLPSQIRVPLLIDEAQSGSTLSVAARELLSGLRSIHHCDHLKIIALQDSRKQGHKQKVQPYRDLTSNEKEGFTVAVVPLPFFTIDKEGFLDYILLPVNAPGTRRPHMQMIMHNTDSEEFIQKLVEIFLRPENLLETIRRVRTQENSSSYQELYNWVLKVTASVGKYSREDALTWLEKYANEVITQKGMPAGGIRRTNTTEV